MYCKVLNIKQTVIKNIDLYTWCWNPWSADLLVLFVFQSIDFHERGKRHQENAQKRIQEVNSVYVLSFYIYIYDIWKAQMIKVVWEKKKSRVNRMIKDNRWSSALC